MGRLSTSSSTNMGISATSFDPWVTGASKDIYGNAADWAQQNPYQVYWPDKLAGQTAPQSSAIDYATGQLANPNPHAAGELATCRARTGAINPNLTIADLMNPYTDAVLQPTLQAINDASAKQRQAIGANATLHGGYGSTAQASRTRSTTATRSRTSRTRSGAPYNQAYNTAQGQQQFNLNTLLGARTNLNNIGATTANTGLSLASLLGGLGAQQQNIGQQGITNDMLVNKQANTGQFGQDATLGHPRLLSRKFDDRFRRVRNAEHAEQHRGGARRLDPRGAL